MADAEQRRGRIQTVCGLIEPEALGPTLMHEHILWDVTRPEVRAACGAEDEVEITLETVWEINRRSILDYGNQHNQDHDVALAELVRLRESGGSAVVDLSNFGLEPDPEGLRRLSKASGVTIVQGAGYYVDEYIPEEFKGRSVDALAAEMVAQVEEGCWGTDVCAGIIGEIGCMWPLRDFERKSLQAAAVATDAVTVFPESLVSAGDPSEDGVAPSNGAWSTRSFGRRLGSPCPAALLAIQVSSCVAIVAR